MKRNDADGMAPGLDAVQQSVVMGDGAFEGERALLQSGGPPPITARHA